LISPAFCFWVTRIGASKAFLQGIVLLPEAHLKRNLLPESLLGDSQVRKLPPDLQNQVDRGFLTREEAQLLNSARGQTSSSPQNAKKPTSDKAGAKAPRNCRTGESYASKTYTTHGEDGHGSEVDFEPYIAAVKHRIRLNWHPKSGPERTTILNFYIS
jgi:hypothetical protein